MIQSIKSKVLVAGLAMLMLSAITGGCGVYAARQLSGELATSAKVSSLLRNHMEADMMHDAMRGDVLSSLLARDPAMGIDVSEIKADAADHAQTFRASVRAGEALADEDLAPTLHALDQPIEEYAKATNDMVALASSDPSAAVAALPKFVAKFHELEGLMSNASDKIEARVAAETKKANAIAATAQTIMITALVISLAGVGLMLMAATKVLVAPLVRLTEVMTRLASGDANVKIPFTDRPDEVGEMAKSVEVFRVNEEDRRARNKEQAAMREAADQERQKHEAEIREAEAERNLVIQQLADGMSHVAAGRNDVRLPNPFPTEYEKLRQDFNAAVSALQRLDAEHRQHEKSLVAADEIRGDVVRKLAESLSAVAGGHLTVRLPDPFPSEYEQLRQDFNAAVEALDSLLGSIAVSTVSVDGGASEIAKAADDLAQRTEQQSASLGQTAAAFDELTATVRQTSTVAQEARQFVAEAKEGAHKSGEVVSQAVSAMGEIESSSKQITQIIGVIDEIAFQTNLLALNAGVEAARAGDAGRGFAVVASEVRALAQRSADAAKEIKGLIQASERHVGNGVNHVSETGKALSVIVEQVSRIDSLITDIAASAQEQSAALSQVNIAVNHMDQATQQNAGMVERTTASAHAMRTNANQLREQIGGFRISNVPTTAQQGRPESAPAQRYSAAPAQNRTMGALALKDQVDTWEEF